MKLILSGYTVNRFRFHMKNYGCTKNVSVCCDVFLVLHIILWLRVIYRLFVKCLNVSYNLYYVCSQNRVNDQSCFFNLQLMVTSPSSVAPNSIGFFLSSWGKQISNNSLAALENNIFGLSAFWLSFISSSSCRPLHPRLWLGQKRGYFAGSEDPPSSSP